MKRVLSAAIVLLLLTITASAQPDFRHRTNRNNDTRISRVEKMQLRKDIVRMGLAQKMARRDGVVTPIERRKLNRLRCKTRMDSFRFRHNGHRRII